VREVTEGRKGCQRKKLPLEVIARKEFESRNIVQGQPHTESTPTAPSLTIFRCPKPLIDKGFCRSDHPPEP